MAAANAHYYATRDPLGAAGDFVTAPEISQMFGELVGVWFTDLWTRAGSPAGVAYVELGPGRGTLAADALRAMTKASLTPPIHFVETSPALRAAQAARIPDATWHDAINTLPTAVPLLIVANEFFDALPVRQLVGGRERTVSLDGCRFATAPGGNVVESCPAALDIVARLAARLARDGGALLVIDYGYNGPAIGDTLQAVRGHAFADPFADPGEQDLTAHVDFAALAGGAPGVVVHGPVGQGAWLERLGIGARAAMLAATAPHRASEVAAARRRLVDRGEMGELFKVMALIAPDWPVPAGFE